MPRGYLKHCKDVTRKGRRGGSSHTNRGRLPWHDLHTSYHYQSTQQQTRIQGHINDGLNDAFEDIDYDEEYSNEFQQMENDKQESHSPNYFLPHGKCAICLEDNKPLIKLMKKCCHDSACRECLRELYIHQAQKDVSNYPLKCFHYQCPLVVTETQLQRHGLIQSPKELTRHYRLCVLAKAYRNNTKNVAHCPECDHPQMISPSTQSVSCKNCTQKYVVDQGFTTDILTIRFLEQFEGDRIGNNDGWAQCPRCRIVISKGYGCNHMTCTCGHEFDWFDARFKVQRKYKSMASLPIVKPAALLPKENNQPS